MGNTQVKPAPPPPPKPPIKKTTSMDRIFNELSCW